PGELGLYCYPDTAFSEYKARLPTSIQRVQWQRRKRQITRCRESWPPVAVSNVRTEGETSSGFAMPIDLFGEPLKPLPIFFGTCAFTFVLDVAAQIAPSDAHCAAQEFVYDV